MDYRFDTILIDEPELGLGPKVQHAFATFLSDATERSRLFPHLKSVYVATHSHLFLNRKDIGSNYIVNKVENSISWSPLKTMGEFHNLQFNLLGNSLEGLFLPSAIVITEGKTDHEYIDRSISINFPNKRISVVSSGGDPKRRIQGLKEAFGDLQVSPLRSRIFVVLDSIHQKGLKQELMSMGVLEENIVIWENNGIEFIYPVEILCDIFSCAPEAIASIEITDDRVSFNGIEKKKNELKNEVLDRINDKTTFPQELHKKFLTPLNKAIT